MSKWELNKRRGLLVHENNKRRGAYSGKYGIHMNGNLKCTSIPKRFMLLLTMDK